jgi:predicted metalloprotease with PDZ domain
MTRILRSAALLLATAGTLQAQAPRPPAQPGRTTIYDVRFPNAVQREASVTARFSGLGEAPLRVRMSRSSPGRYALHEFAKNVYGVKAVDAADRPLRVERTSPHEWTVSGHGGTVVFSYTLYADRADGTYAGIDATRAHLNMPATFAWAVGLESRPIQVTFHLFKPDWRIATQLQPTEDPRTFRAPNLQYFLDSPTHLGALDIREWKAGPAGRQQLIRLAVNHTGSAEDVTAFTDHTRRVVDEMAAVFGELPAFDFGSYTFIACYRANCAGDGMEHRNSTSLTNSQPIASASLQLLGTVSHEFFHAWNVERIRPRSLEPFDFTQANMSEALWLAEGFTSYYAPLVIRRAGIIDDAAYARRLTNAVNTLTNHPGRRFAGAIGMSQQAPFVDAATSVDPHNRVNTFISYYTYGEALGLALDLALRARTPAATLDDFFREMWRRHGREQTAALAPARPYSMADAQAALAAVARDTAFARDWFARYVAGSELPDYPALLERAGLLVRLAAPGEGWIGDPQVAAFDGRVIIAGPTGMGTPLYQAGVAAGDRIISVAGTPVGTEEEYRDAVRRITPGTTVTLSWAGREGPTSRQVMVRESPRVEVVTFEEAGRTPTAAQLAFRGTWLGSRQ